MKSHQSLMKLDHTLNIQTSKHLSILEAENARLIDELNNLTYEW